MRNIHANAIFVLLASAAAHAQAPDYSKVEIKTTPLAGSVSMLQGAGGNIGVSVGDDGTFVIDDQFAPLAPKIKAAIAKISKQPVRFIFNTHWHFDHTGGNEAFGEAGAIIVAHDNVRKRMSVDQVMEMIGGRTIPAAPHKALPVITFTEDVTFHLNGDEIHVFHVAKAHTDGDAVVHFKNADVIHAGDTFINGSYPIIDIGSGGSIDGYIAAQEKILAAAGPNTKIIPGHGPLGDKESLQRTHDIIAKARDAIARVAAAQKTLEAVIAAKPTAPWDDQLGKGFVNADRFITMVYKSLPPKPARPARK